MTYYFDTSALAKLLLPETESEEFRNFFEDVRTRRMLFTSRLSETELSRMAHRSKTDLLAATRRLLSSISLANVDNFTLKQAGDLLPNGSLRTLDAIHIATAMRVSSLEAIITYDHRMTQSAQALGIPTLSPGSSV